MTSQRAGFGKCQAAVLYVLSLRRFAESAANKFFFFFPETGFEMNCGLQFPSILLGPVQSGSPNLFHRSIIPKSSFWSLGSASLWKTFFYLSFIQAHVLRSSTGRINQNVFLKRARGCCCCCCWTIPVGASCSSSNCRRPRGERGRRPPSGLLGGQRAPGALTGLLALSSWPPAACVSAAVQPEAVGMKWRHLAVGGVRRKHCCCVSKVC